MNPEPLEWQIVNVKKPTGLLKTITDNSPNVLRAPVANGWLVYAYSSVEKSGLAFVPDPEHSWEIELKD